MWGNHEYGGVQFYDKDGKKILEAGNIVGEKREFELADGERLVGIKAKTLNTS